MDKQIYENRKKLDITRYDIVKGHTMQRWRLMIIQPVNLYHYNLVTKNMVSKY